uniref:Uncharacterized protein n=1 Tax=Kalanchoe fedtschenkoi TaxID=63787 RepID=A0A7N0RI17_KALFE
MMNAEKMAASALCRLVLTDRRFKAFEILQTITSKVFNYNNQSDSVYITLFLYYKYIIGLYYKDRKGTRLIPANVIGMEFLDLSKKNPGREGRKSPNPKGREERGTRGQRRSQVAATQTQGCKGFVAARFRSVDFNLGLGIEFLFRKGRACRQSTKGTSFSVHGDRAKCSAVHLIPCLGKLRVCIVKFFKNKSSGSSDWLGCTSSDTVHQQSVHKTKLI